MAIRGAFGAAGFLVAADVLGALVAPPAFVAALIAFETARAKKNTTVYVQLFSETRYAQQLGR